MSLEGADVVRLLASPRTVAVIGASTNPRKPAGRSVDYMRRFGFAGRIIPITTRASTVAGIEALASIEQVKPGSVDVAVVAVPQPLVLQTLRQAESRGVQVAIAIANGFEDRDSSARRDLEAFMADSELRLIGPNCLGSIAVQSAAYLTFSSVLDRETPRSGRVGMVTQSGALGNSILQTLIRRAVGMAHWVSTGNEVDVGALEVAAGMLAGDEVDAVGLFLEGITDPEWLPRVEHFIRADGKRLFFLKAATSSEGRSAAAGHTGRLVGSADACREVMREIGAREVATVGALADALAVAGTCPRVMALRRPSVGIVSVSGAAGVIGADGVARAPELTMARFERDALVRQGIDQRISLANPLDVAFLNETRTFTGAVAAVSAAGVSDVLVVIESGLAHDRKVIERELPKDATTILLTSLSEDDLVPAPVVRSLAERGIAYIPTVERAVAALANCVEPSGPVPAAANALAPVPGLIGLEDVATAVGPDFPWVAWRTVGADESVQQLAEEFGLPLVLKAAGRTIEHRSELGAVTVIRESSALQQRYDAVRAVVEAAGDAMVAQRFASGFELMISGIRDVELGEVAFIRLGGVNAELMTLQTVLWSGWSSQRRLAVLRHSAIGELLDGYRNGPKYDLGAVNDLVSRVLGVVAGDLSFLELNPVMVTEDGLAVVDAVARL